MLIQSAASVAIDPIKNTNVVIGTVSFGTKNPITVEAKSIFEISEKYLEITSTCVLFSCIQTV